MKLYNIKTKDDKYLCKKNIMSRNEDSYISSSKNDIIYRVKFIKMIAKHLTKTMKKDGYGVCSIEEFKE